MYVNDHRINTSISSNRQNIRAKLHILNYSKYLDISCVYCMWSASYLVIYMFFSWVRFSFKVIFNMMCLENSLQRTGCCKPPQWSGRCFVGELIYGYWWWFHVRDDKENFRCKRNIIWRKTLRKLNCLFRFWPIQASTVSVSFDGRCTLYIVHHQIRAILSDDTYRHIDIKW